MTIKKEYHIRQGVQKAYSDAALHPNRKHPFPVGRRFAESIGYPAYLLDEFPSISIDVFSGVSNVSIFAEIREGSRVLDLGCGAGLDSLIASRRTGPHGKVIGIDFSREMLSRAHLARVEAGLSNITLLQADAENLPVAKAVIDVVLINGIFNLNPHRDDIFRELARVLKQGGSVYTAELVLDKPLPPEMRDNTENWFA